MPLNPVFDRHPFEGSMVGRMLLNYGELELMVGMLLGNALNSQDTALKTMFRIIGESSRVNAADALMRDAFVREGLESEYADMIGAVRWCVRARNQYAHCHWADDPRDPAGIYFTELSEPAKAIEGFRYWFRHVDVTLLMEQATYFEYAGDCLAYVNFEYLFRQGKRAAHNALMPSKRIQPSWHNPPLQHIPPWLDQVGQQQHIEHFQQSESPDPPPSKEPRFRQPSSRERREAALKPKGSDHE